MTPTQTLKSSELMPAHQTSPPFRNSKLELGPRCLKTSPEQVVPNLDHPFHRHEIERTSCTKLPAQVAREDASQRGGGYCHGTSRQKDHATRNSPNFAEASHSTIGRHQQYREPNNRPTHNQQWMHHGRLASNLEPPRFLPDRS